MRIIDKCVKDKGLKTHVVRYENFVHHPQMELKALFERLNVQDLSDESSFLEGVSHDLGDTVLLHHARAKEGVSSSRIGLWKEGLKTQEKRYLNKVLGRDLKKWDYSGH